MCAPPVIIAAGALAAGAVGTAAIQAGAQRRASRRVARAQEAAQRQELQAQRQEFTRQQAGAPDSASFIQAARRRAVQGLGATFLTGPQGAVTGARLGTAKLLGGAGG